MNVSYTSNDIFSKKQKLMNIIHDLEIEFGEGLFSDWDLKCKIDGLRMAYKILEEGVHEYEI